MPYTTNVAGTVITASYGNANIRDQVVTPFASTGARDAAIASPVIGMLEYISSNDANEGLTSRNSASQWRIPWNLAWGRVASGTASGADQTGITTVVDLTGFSQTFTAVGNRRYKATWTLTTIQNTSNGIQQIQISIDGATTIMHQQTVVAAADQAYSGVIEFALTAGSRVVKLRGLTSAGTMTIATTSLANGQFIIEDIGPSGAPA